MNVSGQRVLRAFIAPLVIAFALWTPMTTAAQSPRASPPPDARQPAVERYVFAITLPDTGKHIVVSAQAMLAAAPTTDTVVFDLDDAMHVTKVFFTCGTDGDPARWVRASGSVKVVVRDPADRTGRYTPRQAPCITIDYDGEPTDGLIIGRDARGHWQAFGDNFPNRARFWLAAIDHPSRKAKVTFSVTAPPERTVVANGTLVESWIDGNGRRVTIWREDRAIPTYGMVIAVGPLDMLALGRTACGFAEDGGCVPQAVWFGEGLRGSVPGEFVHAGEIVEFYARTIGPYPYEKLGHLQTTTRYGGMENPSAIFYFDRGFRRPNGIDEGLIAHETAHQWFGDAVTEREWAHMWLSEGFATFFAALWTQHAHGDTAYAREIAGMRETVLRSKVVTTNAVIDSVTVDPNDLLNDNSYPKGGLVLHMLREEIGDSAFVHGLRQYYAEHRHGNALTQDLQRAVEAAAGRPLGWFFDQWLRRPGWAELRTAFAWDHNTKRVTMQVDQLGKFGPYRLTMPIEVTEASGARRVERVPIDAQPSQSIVLSTTFDVAPRSVRCDPSHSLLAVCTAR
jgi:aminopeptidase N